MRQFARNSLPWRLAPTLLGVRRIGGLRHFSKSLPPSATLLNMPALSPTMTHGAVASWALGAGDVFNAGDVICEIETDKATVDFEAVEEGVLAQILVEAGTKEIEVGKPLAITVEDESTVADVKQMNFVLGDFSGDAEDDALNTAQEEVPAVLANSPQGGHDVKEPKHSVRTSPAAGVILASYGVDVARVQGTGRRGMITKGDALEAVKGKSLAPVVAAPMPVAVDAAPTWVVAQTPAPAPAPSGDYVDVEATNMRKVISKRLTESKAELPHYYVLMDCELDEVLALRKELKEEIGAAPSINDMIVRASALSLRDVPRMNAQISNGQVVQSESIDISVAVATDAGLITPIIPEADKKGLMELSEKTRDLAKRARENKLKLEEFQGGSFTVSNLGMFGINDFTAVINLPQAAIMAVGAGESKVKIKDNAQFDDAGTVSEEDLEVSTVMTVSLSCDRRIVDDATAGQFLQCFRKYISKPKLMSI